MTADFSFVHACKDDTRQWKFISCLVYWEFFLIIAQTLVYENHQQCALASKMTICRVPFLLDLDFAFD
jgi:hypothetical protein